MDDRKAPEPKKNSLEEGVEHCTINTTEAHNMDVSAFVRSGVDHQKVMDLSHVTVGSSPGQRMFLIDPVGPPPSK